MNRYFSSLKYNLFQLIKVCFVVCPLIGQAQQQKQLQEADYPRWGTLKSEQISEKGNWVSYRMAYSGDIDTLFIKHINSNKKYFFTNAFQEQFLNEEIVALKQNNALLLFNCSTGVESRIPFVKKYNFIPNLKMLITLEGETNNSFVIRKENKIIHQIQNVSEYSIDDKNENVCFSYTTQNVKKIDVLNLKNYLKRKTIQSSTEQVFKVLTWQPHNDNITFYGEKSNKETIIYYYNMSTNTVMFLESTHPNFPKDRVITADPNIKLKVADDGEKVFFGITSKFPNDTTALSKGVAIWHSNDKRYYPVRKLKSSVAYSKHTAVWFPKESIIRVITTDSQPWFALTGDQEYALTADPLAYSPFYKWIGDMDYYLYHLKSGKKEMLLKEQSGYENQMSFSPDGRYISYYKEKNWFMYNIFLKSHTNLTKDLNVIWDNQVIDPGNELKVWGQAGWSKDGKYALFYDTNDVWKISVNGFKRERITKGKEENKIYRLDKASNTNKQKSNSNYKQNSYDLTNNLIFQVKNVEQANSGYEIITPKKTVKKLMDENCSITRINKAPESNTIIYVKQSFNSPPTLHVDNLDNANQNLIFQSNKHQQEYQWGISKLITYKNSNGKQIKGALFYPAGYDDKKQYPLVVYIYEKLSHHIHRYINPSLFNSLGFNVSNLTAKGYAVLLPDIEYEKGNSGISATDCVTSAVSEVISMGIANPEKMALVGHSFGGYETNFIITQTAIFAAAICGAGVTDTISHYFTYNTEYNSIDGWRYENQQYRMGSSLFENQEAYYRNSPLHNVVNISTPLLSWSGALDQNVQPRQATTFYAALRRLKKENVMLIYPDEGHILNKNQNQEDLTRKMEDWLDYYLKNTKKPKWMKSDNED